MEWTIRNTMLNKCLIFEVLTVEENAEEQYISLLDSNHIRKTKLLKRQFCKSKIYLQLKVRWESNVGTIKTCSREDLKHLSMASNYWLRILRRNSSHGEWESCILPSRTKFKAPALMAAMLDLTGLCLKRSSNDETYGLLEQPFLDQVFLGWSGVRFWAFQIQRL